MTAYTRPEWLTAWRAAERRALGQSKVVFAGPAPKDFAERLMRVATKLEAEGKEATARNLRDAMGSNLAFIEQTIRRLGNTWTLARKSPSEPLQDGSFLPDSKPAMSGE